MKTTKAIQEELDSLAIEAKALVEVAKRDNRELSDDESARFDEITEKLVPACKADLATAQKREEAIVALSNANRRQNRVEELGEILNRSGSGRGLVLPVNGEDSDADRPSLPCHRMGKLKAFKSEADAYNAGMWMRAVVAREYNRDDRPALEHCHRKGLIVSNASVEGTGSSGGYLVPPVLASALIDVRERVGVMRSLLRLMPMTGDTLTVNRRSSGLTVYYGTENPSADMTSSDKGWQQIELVAKKRYVVHQLSQELVDDALIAVVDDAINEMGYALAYKEDDEAINGTGTSTYGGVTGLLQSIGSAGVYQPANSTGKSVWSGLTLDDFAGTMAKLPDEYAMEPVWLCSRAFYYNVMLRLEAAAGGNTFANMQAGDMGRRMFLGYPVVTTNRMPTATAVSTLSCLFGTFSMGVMLGERTGIRIGRSDDFAFLRDMTTLKATTRYDIKVHAPGTSSAAGAFAGLKTAAS